MTGIKSYSNNSKLINVKTVAATQQIWVYFVTGCENDDRFWFEFVQK
jgi:hypothetical protein